MQAIAGTAALGQHIGAYPRPPGIIAELHDGLLKKTDYNSLEIIILDNESQEPETLAYLNAIVSDPRVRVERCPGAFNFAALNNHGARLAKGSILCLLNNDIEIMSRIG